MKVKKLYSWSPDYRVLTDAAAFELILRNVVLEYYVG